jgi:hypothetical protein
LQRQLGTMAGRLSSMEDHLLMPASSGPPPSQLLYGMPGYGGLPSAPLTTSTIIHTAQSTRPLPIHSIPFPHSAITAPIPNVLAAPPWPARRRRRGNRRAALLQAVVPDAR